MIKGQIWAILLHVIDYLYQTDQRSVEHQTQQWVQSLLWLRFSEHTQDSLPITTLWFYTRLWKNISTFTVICILWFMFLFPPVYFCFWFALWDIDFSLTTFNLEGKRCSHSTGSAMLRLDYHSYVSLRPVTVWGF